ncbi:winged helix-turn-helix transcriptional regulator [Gordonia hirsuta]|uniref:winged helix-turn-helix transcriptional regulator n=1 Tax=Gordonia hirsuta TaxID=53427 RepID=UPI000462E7BF|nr:response regulator transcription factor [Gordonia hirsuta]
MDLLLLTDESTADAVLSSLSLLPHRVRIAPAETSSLVDVGDADAVLVDARRDLAGARALCRLLQTGGSRVGAVLTEGGLVALTADWGIDDFLLPQIGPAELDARLRLLMARSQGADPADDRVTLGELVIDEATYTVRLRGRPIDLTYKEFELLKYLAQNAGRVFTRAQLLHEVWGYDFFGGTRTVDVHVRRLRAKLGSEHESLIGTVRNVGYKAVRPPRPRDGAEPVAPARSGSGQTPDPAAAHAGTATVKA